MAAGLKTQFIVFIMVLLANPVVAKDFLLGGQIPFWAIAGEAGTPSDTPAAAQARPLITARANEMFDIVIPSAATWHWVEPQEGQPDFHRYDWALGWAKANGKDLLVQHLFWSTISEKPGWAVSKGDVEFKEQIFKHLADMREHIGDVPRLTVINEMLCDSYLVDRLGEGIIAEVFTAARATFPNSRLFLNEHGCPNTRPYNQQVMHATLGAYADMVASFKAGNVPFDHVGFQSYFSQNDVEALGGINTFVANYAAAVSAFTAKTGYPLFITELGFDAHDEGFKADFLHAFFTMVRDHPNIEGLIIFHWLDDQQQGTALVNRDGSLTLAGHAYYEVFNR